MHRVCEFLVFYAKQKLEFNMAHYITCCYRKGRVI